MKERKVSEDFRKHFDRLATDLERHYRFRESRKSLQNAISWFLAISGGSFIWFINSFDNFKISEQLAIKPLFIFASILLVLATIGFGFIRVAFYLSQIGYDKAIEDIRGLPDRIDVKKEITSEEEVKKIVVRIGTRSIRMWMVSNNIIAHSWKLIILSFGCYIIGLLAVGFYVIIFICLYL